MCGALHVGYSDMDWLVLLEYALGVEQGRIFLDGLER